MRDHRNFLNSSQWNKFRSIRGTRRQICKIRTIRTRNEILFVILAEGSATLHMILDYYYFRSRCLREATTVLSRMNETHRRRPNPFFSLLLPFPAYFLPPSVHFSFVVEFLFLSFISISSLPIIKYFLSFSPPFPFPYLSVSLDRFLLLHLPLLFSSRK